MTAIVTHFLHIWHNGEDVMVHVAPFVDMEGEYEGYSYRVKGDDRLELKAPDGSTTLHQTIGNALAWIDEQQNQPAPPALPEITSIDPATGATTDTALALTVTGTGFSGDAQIVFDGDVLATAHGGDPNVLTAPVDLSGYVAGPVEVLVRQGSGDSAAVSFEIT